MVVQAHTRFWAETVFQIVGDSHEAPCHLSLVRVARHSPAEGHGRSDRIALARRCNAAASFFRRGFKNLA